MKIIKKTGMGIVYFFIGSIVNYFATLFGFGNRNGGNGYTFTSILIIGIAISAVSYYLRTGKLKKEHKGDESKEKAVFNSSLKEKIKFVAGTSDFKIETVLHFIIAATTLLIPLVQTATAYGLSFGYIISSNLLMTILWMILVPMFMAVMNIITWIKAYNKCYKRKEF